MRRDLACNQHGGRAVTRVPAEPEGTLHSGHANSMRLHFGIAAENAGGVCHPRFDDADPCAGEAEHLHAISEEARWLGFDRGEYESVSIGPSNTAA